MGPGFSAQAELEDVLTAEDVDLRRLRRRDRCCASLGHILFLFLSPPVVATLLGICVAFIRPLQNQFVDLNATWPLGSRAVGGSGRQPDAAPAAGLALPRHPQPRRGLREPCKAG